jgi:hypothetical protein
VYDLFQFLQPAALFGDQQLGVTNDISKKNVADLELDVRGLLHIHAAYLFDYSRVHEPFQPEQAA